MKQWMDFWQAYAETLAISLAFAFGGSAFVLWTVTSATVKSGLLVIFSGLLVSSAATILVHGYLGWSVFAAPLVGLVCGLVAMPILYAIRKGGQRVEDRAADLTDAGIKRVTGKDNPA